VVKRSLNVASLLAAVFFGAACAKQRSDASDPYAHFAAEIAEACPPELLIGFFEKYPDGYVMQALIPDGKVAEGFLPSPVGYEGVTIHWYVCEASSELWNGPSARWKRWSGCITAYDQKRGWLVTAWHTNGKQGTSD
jgi:hypothetical protein